MPRKSEKFVSLRMETYERLKAARRPGQSFDGAVCELLDRAAGRVQLFNPRSGQWMLMDRASGKIVERSETEFEGVPRV